MDKVKIYQLIILVLLIVLVFFVIRQNKKETPPAKPSPQQTPAYDSDSEKYTWQISEVARDLEVPWDLALTSQDEIFITERPGRLKFLDKNGQLKEIAKLSQVHAVGEGGLTGIALHPNFSENGFLYLYYTFRQSGQIYNRVSRFSFKDAKISQEKIILDKLPGGSIHNGGRLRFGPAGKLWILTGDGARPSLAQSQQSLGGKVLRINDDGTIPEGNPIASSAIFSSGHRNPQGLDWHPLTEELIITEHGETAHDEINLIKAGQNYGWPDVKNCNSDDPKFTNPILCSGEETWAPSGLAFLGTKIWRLRNSFFFAGLRGNLLERVEIVDSQVGERETIIKGSYGRLRAVVADSEGNLYVTTSNRDGRGEPKEGDDKILKISPQKVE